MARGSSANSGPAPDPNALRRDRKSDQAGWTVLSAAGRSGSVPAWPFAQLTDREREVWKSHWAKPQAVEWERNGQVEEVAMYVRSLVAAEALDASTAARTLVKQQQEALGLSLPGMLRLRWKIGEPEAKQASQRPERTSSARSRFKVINGGETPT